MPDAICLEELLAIERQVKKSVWILDTFETAFEISLNDFQEITFDNLNRGIEYRWIFSDGVSAREYWQKLEEMMRKQVRETNLLSSLQSRFLPAEILNAVSDFVVYDARTMKRAGYVGVLQGDEYWHLRVGQLTVAQLVEGFDFLWDLPAEIHSLLSVYSSGEDELSCSLPEGLFPEDVTRNINENYQEIMKVYRVGCYTATISLCGRLIETVLHALYEKLEKRSPDSNWGMDALGSRVKKHGVFLPALSEQFSLIKKFRNRAVHGGVSYPNEEQANAVLLLTRDLLLQVAGQASLIIKGDS